MTEALFSPQSQQIIGKRKSLFQEESFNSKSAHGKSISNDFNFKIMKKGLESDLEISDKSRHYQYDIENTIEKSGEYLKVA